MPDKSNGFIFTGSDGVKETYSPPSVLDRASYSPSGSMIITSVPNINCRNTSSLIRYDFPAPDFPNTTSFAFSKEYLSKIIKDPFCSLIPYIIPLSCVSVADVNGKVEASDVVSIFLVIQSLSSPIGIVDLNPSSICKVVVFVIRRIDERVDISFFDSSSRLARLSENRVI